MSPLPRRLCISCSSPIAKNRIEALPGAKLCFRCAQAKDTSTPPPRSVPKVNWTDLVDLTESPIPVMKQPEVSANERASRQIMRQVEIAEDSSHLR